MKQFLLAPFALELCYMTGKSQTLLILSSIEAKPCRP